MWKSKNYAIVLSILLFFLTILYSISRTQFEYMDEYMEKNSLSLHEFNETYNADLVGLPDGLFALGVHHHQYHTFSKLILNYKPMIEYWMKYIDPSLPSKYYVILCPMDGFGSLGNVNNILTERIMTPDNLHTIKGLDGPILYTFETNEYPIFHSKRIVYAACKHINDTTTVLLPDFHYILEHGYKYKLKEIDNQTIPYRSRKSECIWRGMLVNGSVHNFLNSDGKTLNPRFYFQKLHKEGKFPKVNFEDKSNSITEQMKYKYILDIDGFASTWSATVWKLYSGSVLLKCHSKWKQWYYDDFHEWVHYVPVEDDFSDLNQKIEWCIEHEDECLRIVDNAKKLVETKLNWEQVKQDAIQIVKESLDTLD